jgi:large repetitive protein
MRRSMHTHSTRRLMLEALESRQVLSGNVAAVIDASGNLIVTGDNSSNYIVISKGANPGEITISGGMAGSTAGSQTKVNGSLSPVTLSNFHAAIKLNMQHGYDQVVVTNLLMDGSFQAALGPGNDRLSIQSDASNVTNVKLNSGADIATGDVRLGVFVNADGEAGNDVVGLHNAILTGNFGVNGGAGNDTFVQTGSNPDNNRVGGRVLMNMEDGDDTVQVERLNVGGNFTVNDRAGSSSTIHLNGGHVSGNTYLQTTNGGDDISIGLSTVANGFITNKLIVSAFNGDDQVNVRSAWMSDLTIYATGGNNHVAVDHVVARGTLTIGIGDGDDNVNLNGVLTGVMRIRTWAGADTVTLQGVSAFDGIFDLMAGDDDLEIHNSVFGNLTADLGDGNDTLGFGGLTVTGTASFDGGTGVNTQNNAGGNSITDLQLQSL